MLGRKFKSQPERLDLKFVRFDDDDDIKYVNDASKLDDVDVD